MCRNVLYVIEKTVLRCHFMFGVIEELRNLKTVSFIQDTSTQKSKLVNESIFDRDGVFILETCNSNFFLNKIKQILIKHSF